MTTITYPLTGLHCKGCIGRVTQKLKPLADEVVVTLEPMQVVLTHPKQGLSVLQAAVAEAGNYALLPPASEHQDKKSAAGHRGWAHPAINTIADTSTEVPSMAVQGGWLATYRPLLLIVAYILAGSLLLQWGHGGSAAVTTTDTMRYFMAGFFLVFSFFKLLDLQAFADAYASYDLLARRWRGWGLVYPFIELGLGVAYLAHASPVLTHAVTIVVMGFSAIGVVQAVTKKRRIQCACLGAVFKLPMSTVTIVEDLGMVAMAVAMLALGA